MTAATWTIAILLAVSSGGVVAAGLYAIVARRRDSRRLAGQTAIARAASYALLALALAGAVALNDIGVAILVAVIGLVALWEWAQLSDLPRHHVAAMTAAHLVVVAGVQQQGTQAADWLLGGLVLVGALWPVVRADPTRAVRDLGFAAIGFVFITVMLVHAVALVHDHGAAGAVLFAAMALGCAGSDIGAFLVGRRFGRAPLARRLSPAKTRAGVVGNLLGAAAGLAIIAPALFEALPALGVSSWFVVVLVPLVALGSVWGDLFESAAKREAQVKDAGAWLPGFGGMLDRIDSLLVTVPLVYWALRIAQATAGTGA